MSNDASATRDYGKSRVISMTHSDADTTSALRAELDASREANANCNGQVERAEIRLEQLRAELQAAQTEARRWQLVFNKTREQLQAAQAQVAALTAEREAVRTPCAWQEAHDGEYWDTACDYQFTLEEGGPAENDMKFCPNCGRPVAICYPAPDDNDEDDDPETDAEDDVNELRGDETGQSAAEAMERR